jgi:hypothetical protein
MKSNIFLFVVVLLIFTLSSLSAQTNTDKGNEIKTIFGTERSRGGYGAFSFGYTQINDNNTYILGGRGAAIFNHYLAVGGAAYGFFNINTYLDDNFYAGLVGGYGGLLVEPIIFAKFPVHLSLPMILGGGVVSRYVEDIFSTTGYFVFVPGAELEFNVSRRFRLAFGVDYRITSNIEFSDYGLIDPIIIDPKMLNTISGHLVFKFGKF